MASARPPRLRSIRWSDWVLTGLLFASHDQPRTPEISDQISRLPAWCCRAYGVRLRRTDLLACAACDASANVRLPLTSLRRRGRPMLGGSRSSGAVRVCVIRRDGSGSRRGGFWRPLIPRTVPARAEDKESLPNRSAAFRRPVRPGSAKVKSRATSFRGARMTPSGPRTAGARRFRQMAAPASIAAGQEPGNAPTTAATRPVISGTEKNRVQPDR